VRLCVVVKSALLLCRSGQELAKVALVTALAQAAILLATCITIEHIAVIERYSMRDRIPGLVMQLVGSVASFVLIWPVSQAWQEVAPWVVIPLWDWLRPLGAVGLALQFLLLLMVADFLAYWRHRMEHSRWWWPIHKVHHAPTELHAANDIGHPVQIFFTFLFITMPMSLFKLSGPEIPLALFLTSWFLSIYIHSPIDFHFGPLRRLVVDNRFHRIHHSLEPRHFDRNFGICFSVWDQMFRTAYFPTDEEWPKVGVAGVSAPRTITDFLMLPLDNLANDNVRKVVVDAGNSGVDTEPAGPRCGRDHLDPNVACRTEAETPLHPAFGLAVHASPDRGSIDQ
jgi:sterol desaturase/sphingolipid hydroxylase (fatty acid hydroxylase superfamily)